MVTNFRYDYKIYDSIKNHETIKNSIKRQHVFLARLFLVCVYNTYNVYSNSKNYVCLVYLLLLFSKHNQNEISNQMLRNRSSLKTKLAYVCFVLLWWFLWSCLFYYLNIILRMFQATIKKQCLFVWINVRTCVSNNIKIEEFKNSSRISWKRIFDGFCFNFKTIQWRTFLNLISVF